MKKRKTIQEAEQVGCESPAKALPRQPRPFKPLRSAAVKIIREGADEFRKIPSMMGGKRYFPKGA